MQILLGLSKTQNADIVRAAALCAKPGNEERALSRAEFIRAAAHAHAVRLLKEGK